MTFVIMDQTKGVLTNRYENMDNVTKSMFGGAVAGGARLSILGPLDLLKTRAQAQKNGKIRYKKMISTLYR